MKDMIGFYSYKQYRMRILKVKTHPYALRQCVLQLIHPVIMHCAAITKPQLFTYFFRKKQVKQKVQFLRNKTLASNFFRKNTYKSSEVRTSRALRSPQFKMEI